MVRRVLWVIIGTLSLVLVAGVAATGLLLTRTPSTPVGLVVVGADSRLRLVGNGAEERVLAEQVSAEGYRYPSIAPDGRKLAYIASDGEALVIYRLNVQNGSQVELFRSTVNQPINLAWSPDSRYVTFLVASRTGFITYIVAEDGETPARVVATGQPSFFSWRADGQSILLHVDGHAALGGRVDVYDIASDRTSSLLSDPGLFQAPAWSVDGESLFYVAQPPITSERPTIADIESVITRVAADGSGAQALVSEKQSDLRIVRSPNSDQIAYVLRLPDDASGEVWGALKMVGDDGQVRTLSRPDERVTAFFWSPDGTQIAYLSHADNFIYDGPRAWRVVNVGDGNVREFADFRPSPALAELQVFFDAFVFSFSPWSPDGTRLAYGTRDGVYVLDVASGTTDRVGEGTMGVWVGGKD